MASAICSSVMMVLFWDGSLQLLITKRLLGLLINVGILLVSLLFWKLNLLTLLSEHEQGCVGRRSAGDWQHTAHSLGVTTADRPLDR